jgi:hypothetical protein
MQPKQDMVRQQRQQQQLCWVHVQVMAGVLQL